MKKIYFPLALLTANVFNSFSQTTFQKTHGTSANEAAYNLIQTSDNSYVMTGIYSDQSTYAIKIDGNGDTLWTKKYYMYSPGINGLQETTDGGLIISGVVGDAILSANDFKLIKTDENGDTLWTQLYIGTQDHMNLAIEQTTDGGYIMGGTTDSIAFSNTQNYSMLVYKLDPNGAIEWSKLLGDLGTNSDEEMSDVKQTPDGGFIVCGRVYGYVGSGDWDIYLIKLDANGNTVWSKTYGGAGTDVAASIAVSTDGTFVVAGTTSSFGAGGQDAYIIKIDEDGNVLWSNTYGELGQEGLSSIKETSTGYVASGYTSSFGAGNIDVYALNIDAAGTIIWSHSYGGASADRSYSVTETADNGFAIAGNSASFGSGAIDYYMIKTDSDGNSGCQDSLATTISATANTLITSTTLPSQNFGGLGTSTFIPPTFPAGVSTVDVCSPASNLNAPTNLIATVFKTESSNVQLTWNDNSNNETGFKIERSTNGTNYTVIDSVLANVASFTDNTITQSTLYYYRVYAFNLTDNSAFSNVEQVNTGSVGIHENTGKILVYPNPATDYLNLSGFANNTSISLINLTGLVLFESQNQNSTLSISIQHLAAGIYFLKIGNEFLKWEKK